MKKCLSRRVPWASRGPVRLFVCLFLSALTVAQLQAASGPLAIKADKIYVGDGRVIEHGTVLIEDGRITQIGADIAIPEGTTVIEMERGSVTPGLIDANARIESDNLIPVGREAAMPNAREPESDDQAPQRRSASPGSPGLEAVENRVDIDPLPLHVGEEPDEYEPEALAVGVGADTVITEQSSEVVPHTSVLDGLNLQSGDFDRLVRGGVTTAYASPDASAVIGARGAVVHTAGSADARVLVPAAAVKATVGSDPSYFGTRNRSPSRSSMSMYARRPNSRMGLVWVFRKAFYDTQRRQRGQTADGADTASPAATAVLAGVLRGEIPLRIQARIQRDILTALRLADEFDLRFTLEEATEAYRCIDELKAAQVPVIFGPIYETPSGIRQRSGEGQRSRYYTFRALLDAGIPTALSAREPRRRRARSAGHVCHAVRCGSG